MRVVVFANGVLENPAAVRRLIRPGDPVVAADGGARHCRTLGLRPDVIVGDMDSLTPEEALGFEREGAKIIRHPVRKDKTDLELALETAKGYGAGEILVLGALGQRWDMTLANVMLLCLDLGDTDLWLADGLHEIRVLKGGRTLTLSGRAGDTLSLIPMGRPAEGVTLDGLEYPLNRAVLTPGTTWGISNVLTGDSCRVHLEKGLLLCVLIRRGPA